MQRQSSSQGIVHDGAGVEIGYRPHGQQHDAQHPLGCPVPGGTCGAGAHCRARGTADLTICGVKGETVAANMANFSFDSLSWTG